MRAVLAALVAVVLVVLAVGVLSLYADQEVEVPIVGSSDEIVADFDGLPPTRGYWLVVDSYRGRLEVYRGAERIRDATCSTGSGNALRDPQTGKMWVFQTPVGERTIHRKVTDPVWTKPDWAFVEEGVEPPLMGSVDRVDRSSLGDYALYLGDGYMIHGTLFQTLLGRRITHGCIRLGDDDLRWVYEKVPVGTRVYIY